MEVFDLIFSDSEFYFFYFCQITEMDIQLFSDVSSLKSGEETRGETTNISK